LLCNSWWLFHHPAAKAACNVHGTAHEGSAGTGSKWNLRQSVVIVCTAGQILRISARSKSSTGVSSWLHGHFAFSLSFIKDALNADQSLPCSKRPGVRTGQAPKDAWKIELIMSTSDNERKCMHMKSTRLLWALSLIA
jgi:hypothetical protein